MEHPLVVHRIVAENSRKRRSQIHRVPGSDIAFILIDSPKHGIVISYISASDIEFVKAHTWTVHKFSNGHFRVTTNLKSDHPGKYKTVGLYRLLLNPPPDKVVDHIDGDTLNNTRSNLRICTQQQNLCNRPGERGSAVPFKGVAKARHKFRAYLNNKHLGTFDTPEQAALAYNRAAMELHGKFARLNQIAA